MRRVKAVLSYDGSQFFGFQKQNSTTQTITHAIESALHTLHIHSSITGSGRTDAGVHATGQIIHFDIPEYWNDLSKLTLNLNRKLTGIYIKHICFVSQDFHARFHAKRRIYRYIFKTKKPSLFEEKYISYYPSFEPKLLQEALQHFEGKHDFDLFRKTGTDTHTNIREIYTTHYRQRGDYHYIYFEANGFLRAQIRMMVDTAMQVAQQTLTLEELQAQLSCQKRHNTRLAPPQGLYLARIIYQ